MEIKVQQVEITMTPDEIHEVATSLKKMELCKPSKPKCCIYTVPDYIKEGKEECYRPFATSIGPVFYKDEKLEDMQELKGHFLKGFIEHSDNNCQSYEPYINFVREHEAEIHECYEKEISLSRNEFIKMIVLDAAFLIYLFLIYSNKVPFPSVGNKLEQLHQCLGRDLLLEENQLPFFVLTGIYNMAFSDDAHYFTNLVLESIHNLAAKIPSSKAIQSIFYYGYEEIPHASNIQHLVDLQRTCCCIYLNNLYPQKSKGKQIWLEVINGIIDVIKCRVDFQSMCCKQNESKEEQPYYKFDSAKHLRAAGVKFELSKSHNLMGIKFDKRKGVLEIPMLTLDDGTEPFLRNVLFFEQCHYVNKKQIFGDYTVFLDTLIDTVEDVEVLKKQGILQNDLGSDEDAVDLFNKLNRNIAFNSEDSAFWFVSKGLKDYASSRRNKWKAILWSKYFRHPWAIISVIAAVILLILTVLQTITGFLQVTNLA